MRHKFYGYKMVKIMENDNFIAEWSKVDTYIKILENNWKPIKSDQLIY